MSDELERVLAAARERVDPGRAVREQLQATADELCARATAAVRERCPDADVVLVGSSARDTWILDDRDIDVFVRLPPDVDRETLERVGLEVGHETLDGGHEEFAEHPYVTGEYEGFAVDVVPCYRLEDATEIRSAVDRTPFHTRYLEERLDDELAAEVRVCKLFLTTVGVYGSNLRTEGFSGYLTELLVLEYGGFRPFVEAVADWHPPLNIDPEGHASATFDDPLVVIDPTDPGRNVAAVCSAEQVARLQHYARDLLADPRLELFEPGQRAPLSADELRGHLDRREATAVAIRTAAPDVVDDQLYPQLRKSLDGITSALDRRGFDVLRASVFADETVAFLLELAVVERPAIERHEGPPVAVREHAEGFFAAYADDPDAYGPFVDGERYVVERPREWTNALEYLESEQLLDVALGADVEPALEEGYDLLVADDLADLVDEFGVELREHFDPVP